ncbi:leptomycin B resistance protein pmd1 [Lentithecium fluviatile CBS 122367]|uniref:Leptomycin B resistance protein pmd1 n=1 Tax=Lentithecium fluviatile CBS 122367 TaxID=1168545 RepID=A0A6G1JH59_9PLEO|nr:leptomycin B resistance protein pmd1 [Lentithecium fluviatile CBS 122367]
MHITKPSGASPKPFFTFFRLLFYANPTWLDKTLLCVGFVAAIAAGVPFPLVGIIFGQLVDNFNKATCDNEQAAGAAGDLQSSINSKVLLLIYIAIATFVLIYTHILCWNIASQRLAQRIRDRYLKSLLGQDVAFFDNLQAGEVSSRLNGDIQAIETGTSEKVGVFLTCISFCVTAYIVAFIKDAKLAGMLVSLVPAFLLMAIVGGHLVSKHSTRVSDYFAKASAIASEALSNVALVHALGANERLEGKFRAYLGDARSEGIKKAVATAVQAGLLYFIAFSANALAYWQGSRKIADNVQYGRDGTTVGQIYTVIFILVDGAIVLSQVAPLLPLFGGAIAAFERLKNDIDQRPTIDGTSVSGYMPPVLEGGIEFRRVSFTYPSRPEQPVLQDVSFHCEAGKLTAIVGLSGSGKSTVAALIARFYDPQNGAVVLDGHDIRTLNVKTLRGFISLVQQEPSLLDRSILENIALGLVNSSVHTHLEGTLLSDALSQVAEEVRNGQDLVECAEERGSHVAEIVRLVQQAADLADAVTFINRLEFGLATTVGSSGSLLSGGQKQRIALARALVRDPRILILDEATAALDSASEQRIQAAIEKASKGRTVISIAHRLSTIRSASKIIVMKTGNILEQGTHDDLMYLDGSYADMVRLQSVKPVDEVQSSRASIEADDIDAVKEQSDVVDSEKTKDHGVQSVGAFNEDEGDIMGQSISTTMAPLIRPYLLLLVLAFFAALIVGGTYSASGAIFGNTIGSFSPCRSPNYIRSRGLLFSGLFFMLACVEFLANFTSWSVFGLISERLIYKVRVRSLRSLLQQPLQWHESHNRSPSMLLGYITDDGNALAGFSGSIVGTLFSVIVNFVAAVILSHVIAWRIAIVLVAIVPLLLGAGFMQLRSISRFAEKHAGAFSSSVGITVEAVSNIRTIAALSLEDEVLQTYRRSLTAPRKEMVLQSFKTNVWLAIANSMGNVLYAFAHWWGSKNILEGRYTQTQYFIILMALLVSAQLWGQLFTLAPEISRARRAIARIVGLLELKGEPSKVLSGCSTPEADDVDPEKKDVEAFANSPATLRIQAGAAVEFRNVAFSYPARRNVQVLTSISLSIRPGQFCALVGPSGAGKSTVLALLERFYSPDSGSITINGLDVSQLQDTSFRNDIAYVPQDNVLFQGTIHFNICLGARPGYTPSNDEIHEACRLANIHETIMSLPQGYDTECGANGSQFSGGQRQRLSIARALVRKPKLLLLDESTSALDAESEKALELGLETAVKGKGVTVIAIAHRLRTIARADMIFLIDGGKVVDQGRHEQLVGRSESYRINALHQMLA